MIRHNCFQIIKLNASDLPKYSNLLFTILKNAEVISIQKINNDMNYTFIEMPIITICP